MFHIAKHILTVGARFVLVSRHEGAIQWVAEGLEGQIVGDVIHVPDYRKGEKGTYFIEIVRGDVQADYIRGAHVIGNLPLALAAVCGGVFAIEFGGPPPRGVEYTAHDMVAAAARLGYYHVKKVGF